jgi:hypothetical protein
MRRSIVCRAVMAASLAVLVGCSGGSGGSMAGASAEGAVLANDVSAPVAAPFGIGRCDGVRPGATVFVENGGQCTLNFMFRDRSGADYIATAGHCVLSGNVLGSSANEEMTWQPGQGPRALDGSGAPFGRFAYAVEAPPRDFGLIRLDPGVSANAAVCHFGGPAGLNEQLSTEPVVLSYYGGGVLTGDVLPARSALALSLIDPDEVFLTGLATPGDSGAPVLDPEGRAVGVLVTVGLLLGGIGTGGSELGTVGVTRLAPQLRQAERALGQGSLVLVQP